MCCCKTSEPKSGEAAQSKDGSFSRDRASPGSSRLAKTWKRCRRWFGKRLRFWKKRKRNVAEVSCDNEQSFVEHEVVQSRTSSALGAKSDDEDACNSNAPAGGSCISSAEGIKIEGVSDASEDSATCEKSSVGSASNSSCAGGNRNRSYRSSLTNLKIEWIAGEEETLCEENIENFTKNLAEESISEDFLSSEQGEGEITVGDEIHRGAYGSIRKGTWTTRKINGEVRTKDVAIKVVNYIELKEVSSCVSELKALTRLKHRNIIEMHFILIYDRRILLGLELVSQGDLNTYLREDGPLYEKQARIWFGQIVDAIWHCHVKGIAHLDIKPQNILIYDVDKVKLTDFGLSLVQPNPARITAEQYKSNVYCGTLRYMAPEIFTGNIYDSRKCDVWSLGVLLFHMVTRKYPFSLRNIKRMDKLPKEDLAGSNYLNHANKLYKQSFRTRIHLRFLSRPNKDLILDMLKINVKERATIWQVKHHDWLTNNGKPEV